MDYLQKQIDLEKFKIAKIDFDALEQLPNFYEMLQKTIAFKQAKKLQTIEDYLTMFNYNWYGKQTPRSAYDKLFKQLNEIIKSEMI